MNKKLLINIIVITIFIVSCNNHSNKKSFIAIQTDFGGHGNDVASMYGVAYSVDPNLTIEDLTHTIPAYSIWDAALELDRVAKYWPKGTVFVSVVDPGVGTDRKSVVLKTKTGHYFVTPDNGTLTFIADSMGVDEVREIDESINRLKGSEDSYTFHGRDVYVYTAAKLAGNKITFEEVGKSLGTNITVLNYTKSKFENGILYGSIASAGKQYGNVWTTISRELVIDSDIKVGDFLIVKIYNDKNLVFEGEMHLMNTFGDVEIGSNLAFFNSQLNLSFAINQGNFASKYNIKSGSNWSVEIIKK